MKKQIMALFLAAIMLVLLLFSACSPAKPTQPSTTGSTSTTPSSEVTELIDQVVTADSFSIIESADGIGSILTGELTSGVTVNARVYCEKDLTDPGTGSVDTAVTRDIMASYLDSFISPEWTMISDQTSEVSYDRKGPFDQRIAEYIDNDNNQIHILNSYSNFVYSVHFENISSLDLLQEYDRIPWFSTDLAWGTEEFDFGTGEEAFSELKKYAERLELTISPVYKIEYVTPDVFDVICRLHVADESEGLPDKTWGAEDSAYWIEAAQEWNGLPVFSGDFAHVYDGINLSGDEYHNTFFCSVNFLQTAAGVQNFWIFNSFEPLEKGTEEDLVSLLDALQALKVHMENPKNENEILYRLPEQDVLIDRIELCYLPIGQATLNADDPGAGFTEGLLETEDGSPKLPYQMTPCWTFRIISTINSFVYTDYCAVNAISGEYIFSTDATPVI